METAVKSAPFRSLQSTVPELCCSNQKVQQTALEIRQLDEFDPA